MEVFRITELLDMILTVTDPQGLLRLQQVCKLFHNHIANDALCQCRLFLRASGPIIDNDRNRNKEFKTEGVVLQFNPFLAKISNPPSIDWFDFIKRQNHHPDSRHPVPPTMQEWNEEHHHIIMYPPVNSRPGNFWNNMFITQPPVTAVAFFTPQSNDVKSYAATYPDDFEVRNSNGVTIGDLVKEWKRVTTSDGKCHHVYLAQAPLLRCTLCFCFLRETLFCLSAGAHRVSEKSRIVPYFHPVTSHCVCGDESLDG